MQSNIGTNSESLIILLSKALKLAIVIIPPEQDESAKKTCTALEKVT